MPSDIDKFVHDQLSVWRTVAAKYRDLKSARTRQIISGGLPVTLQCNPGRIPVEDIGCPLCAENRPEFQHSLKFEGRKGRKYDILVNRAPIFQSHLVITRDIHTEQTIWHRYVDMLDMARELESYVIFYNGPHCGTSVPSHAHFQACPKGYLPLERSADRLLRAISDSNGEIPEFLRGDIEFIANVRDAQLFHYKKFHRGIFALRAETAKSMAKMFYRLLDCIPVVGDETEPRFNVLTYFSGGEYRVVVMCRRAHRPHHFYAEGDSSFAISPGAADCAGFMVVPRESDFDRLTPEIVSEILDEVYIDKATEDLLLWRLVRTQPTIEVGIMSGTEIRFEIISDGAGPQKVFYREGKIDYNGTLYDELVFEAVTISTLFAEPSFILYGVTIGVDFHWERTREEKFAGALKFIVAGGKVHAVNVIGVEDYLLSVISSEMRSTANEEFLKAHAVISRSWVMSQIRSRREREAKVCPISFDNLPEVVTWLERGRKESGIKWWDHSDHHSFDVCADDHCQRYQGLTMAIGEKVRNAVDRTWGQVLTYDGKIADARFSKCCGGTTERFSTAWEDKDYPYLPVKEDPWCNTKDKSILESVLNDYDLETVDFHDWKVRFTVEELSEIIRSKSGTDIGTLQALEPVEVGGSGRIKVLRIVGSKATIVIGKELNIRRTLSKSHLYSSAFKAEIKDGKVTLTGRGWGHGVGLCQIGAAVMASKGKTYREILEYYYPGTVIE